MTNISTLYDELLPAAVDSEIVERKYPAMIALAREILGVYANCYSLLEIWPPGFRTYNLIIPNFTNVPFSLFGFGPPKDLLGLAMYEASRTAGCAYCTAHSCTFALRRGARPEDIVGGRSERAIAVAKFAEGLSRIPANLPRRDMETMLRFVSDKDAEWLALGVAMMGFLNKFMDAAGIALEGRIVSDVSGLLSRTEWKPGKHWAGPSPASGGPPPVDNLGTYLRILRKAPAAIRLEAGWTKGVPSTWPEAGSYLKDCTGYDFAVLAKLTHKRAIRTTTTVLRDNLDSASSSTGLAVKPLAALVYATIVADEELQRAARELALCHSGDVGDVEALAEFAMVTGSAESRLGFLQKRMSLSSKQACSLLLTHEAAPSPATLQPDVVALVTHTLSPEQIIEMMVWVSVLQLLHRLNVFCFRDA